MITNRSIPSFPGTMPRTAWSGPQVAPHVVRAHHLLCAACVRGGCMEPPVGRAIIDPLLELMWRYPFAPLLLQGDLDITRAHYFDAYAGREEGLPENFAGRRDDYAARRKDLEVIRVLGIMPNTVMPAYWAYRILFARQATLDGICRTDSQPSEAWPECPHARAGYYERIAGDNEYGSLETQTREGEAMAGHGLWAMVRPRTREEMAEAKTRSARFIREEADRLYIRPNHLLCILCTAGAEEPLIQDNLVEVRQRMEADPHIPVTLVEGCCMVCDPCNVYHPGEHLCYHAHIKNTLRDLMILERLGLPPGATLPAGELYARVYQRIGSLKEICGWRDGSDTAPCWSPCSYQNTVLENARAQELLTGKA